MSILNERGSGVLLHFTSLPGPAGSGDFGPNAFRFVDWLAAHGQTYWQVLPVHPPSDGASPYQTSSTFAGHLALIAMEPLIESGWLQESEAPRFDDADATTTHADWPRVMRAREHALRLAFARFSADGNAQAHAELSAFIEDERAWLDDFSLYCALKRTHGGVSWTDFPAAERTRDEAALSAARKTHANEIAFVVFTQWVFFTQLRALHTYANQRGVRIIGDIPIFVADDSAEVWAHPELFELGEDGKPTVVAGVPPDAFSETGQRWGNALYRWPAHAAENYAWWIARIKHALRAFDVVRLDHFIGFSRYWAIDASCQDARTGAFHAGPGKAFFQVLFDALPELSLIAEDLGILTPAVVSLRDAFALPGMKVLQFCFGSDEGSLQERPHAWPKNAVVYTGTHDNDTLLGWLSDPRQADDLNARAERANAMRYVGPTHEPAHRAMIRLLWSTAANTAIVPLQDLVGLDTRARFNTPGTVTDNWRWRMRVQDVQNDCGAWLATVTEIYGRRRAVV